MKNRPRITINKDDNIQSRNTDLIKLVKCSGNEG